MNISAHFEPSRHIVRSGWSSPLEAKASQGRKAAQRARDRSIMEEEKEGVGGAEVSERDATDSSPKFPGMWRSSISHLFYTAPILKRFCFPLTSLFHSLHPSIHPSWLQDFPFTPDMSRSAEMCSGNASHFQCVMRRRDVVLEEAEYLNTSTLG